VTPEPLSDLDGFVTARNARINAAGRRGMNSFADVEEALMDCAVAVGYERVLTAEDFDVVAVIADEVASVVAERDRLAEALRGLLTVTDHRGMNEQITGGDECDCDACRSARAALDERQAD
jgi:hydroxypyruvate isomerase